MVLSSGDSGEGGSAGTRGRKHGDAGPSVTSPTAAARPPTRAQMRDRAAGAIIGAVVGEALGMGIVATNVCRAQARRDGKRETPFVTCSLADVR